MCSNQTISQIAKILEMTVNGSFYDIYPGKHLQQNFSSMATAQEFHDALVEMNIAALNERYDQDISNTLAQGDYELCTVKWLPSRPDRDVLCRWVKNLDCYLYQCSEGDIPKRDLFKALQELKRDICYLIVLMRLIGDEESGHV